MKLLFESDKLKAQCTSLRSAERLLGGNKALAVSLLSRINALSAAGCLKDLILQPAFHFHALSNKKGRDLTGLFAIDVKSRKEQWRIILQPLDTEDRPFVPCHVDEIAEITKTIRIAEVSKHYE